MDGPALPCTPGSDLEQVWKELVQAGHISEDDFWKVGTVEELEAWHAWA